MLNFSIVLPAGISISQLALYTIAATLVICTYMLSRRDLTTLYHLGERGALFACKQEGERSAHICFKPFGQRASEKEWIYELRSGTEILGIAAGGLPPSSSLRQSEDGELQGYGNIVVATNESDLTFLSGTGRERRIIGFGAEFVTMISSSEWVFIVHREGSTTIDGKSLLEVPSISFLVRFQDPRISRILSSISMTLAFASTVFCLFRKVTY